MLGEVRQVATESPYATNREANLEDDTYRSKDGFATLKENRSNLDTVLGRQDTWREVQTSQMGQYETLAHSALYLSQKI